MIRLSGTAADAAGAGQLQGSSGFGRRSLFRARRDGPDVPEKPVRRCFGQKVPGNGWAFANFFYLWRSKQYAMMDLKTIRAELRKLTAIVDGWGDSGPRTRPGAGKTADALRCGALYGGGIPSGIPGCGDGACGGSGAHRPRGGAFARPDGRSRVRTRSRCRFRTRVRCGGGTRRAVFRTRYDGRGRFCRGVCRGESRYGDARNGGACGVGFRAGT